MTEFITVPTFTFGHEIIVLKTILNREFLPYLFQNENLVSLDLLASLSYVGIKLKIHPNDKEEVQQILDDLNNNLKIV